MEAAKVRVSRTCAVLAGFERRARVAQRILVGVPVACVPPSVILRGDVCLPCTRQQQVLGFLRY